jgi:CheY-specific phosphatase CheX
MKTIETNCFGIVVTLDGNGGGTIKSDLREPADVLDMDSDPEAHLYDAALDGLEALILAHACAGIDITTPAYLEGIETAVEAMGSHF